MEERGCHSAAHELDENLDAAGARFGGADGVGPQGQSVVGGRLDLDVLARLVDDLGRIDKLQDQLASVMGEHPGGGHAGGAAADVQQLGRDLDAQVPAQGPAAG